MRNPSLTDIVGQEEVMTQLRLVLRGAQLRQVPIPHLLLGGPAGHGKSTIARAIAHEWDARLVSVLGGNFRRPEELVATLCGLSTRSVLLIDEIHRLPPPAMEVLYGAMEDGVVTRMLGTGVEARASVTRLPTFVVVGATTNPGMLTRSLRDRFGFHANLAPYTVEEIAEIVRRSWVRRECQFDQPEPMEVARRSKLVPRRALHLAERVLDWCAVHHQGMVRAGTVHQALLSFGIDENGLTSTDWRILETLCLQFGGRCVGLNTLAAAVDLEPQTLRDDQEPPLVRAGLIVCTRAGRLALPRAHQLLMERGH